MKFKNSKGMIALLYFAIVFFPLMSLTSGYLAYEEYVAADSEDIVKLIVGAVFFGFFSPFGFKLVKFVRLEYTLTDEGIEVSTGKSSEVHTWDKQMRIKDSSFLQLFWLYAPDNKTIAMVDVTV